VDTSLRAVARKYEIPMATVERLRILRDFEIIIVCDDSGSMMTTVDGTQRTRWNELCSIVKIIIEIGIIFDSNGIDIYFINGRRFPNVKDSKDVEHAFEIRPSGYTPLVPVLDNIFQSPLSNRGRDKKLLVFVATDGVPTDEHGNENIPELERIMREKRRVDTTHVCFLLCTDDPDCVAYLSEWDRTMLNFDVIDDFYTEREKIRRHEGNNYRFSLGDYVVKALTGAVDRPTDIINDPV